jgi:hypothetical protein
MAMKEKNPGRGGRERITRSETVTVRLDPKLRYLADLAARKQRRTLSSFIEWAIEDSLRKLSLNDGVGADSAPRRSIAQDAEVLWDVDAPDRFARLAFWYPELLTHEEQMRWKLIRECGYLWLGGPDEDGKVGWRVSERTLVFERLRETWDKFCAVASGTADPSTLPTWDKVLLVQPPDDFR